MERTYWHSDSIDKGYPQADEAEVRTPCSRTDPTANLTSSLCDDGLHRPALDIDVPSEFRPSTTAGHGHLLIDTPMPWWKYRLLLRVLVWVGIIERKYYDHSVNRGMTMLRLPHVRKGVPRAT